MTHQVIHGNCLDVLPTLTDCSVDSIVTDPPYELGFMGKTWDNSGIAYNVDVWRECLRVLKPGGHLLAFGGTRTYHRMAVAIEDAGFEIRDSIHWIYGSGFPKSLDVSKAIDKMAGAEREVIGYADPHDPRTAMARKIYGTAIQEGHGQGVALTAPATDDAKRWEGWGTALKPAHEPIVLARKPLAGTVANNVLTYGTGALNIDASRIGDNGGSRRTADDIGEDARTNNVYGKGLGLANPAPRIDGLGRWPANVILDAEVGAILDKQSGVSKDGTAVRRNGNAGKGLFPVRIAEGSADSGYGGQGGASRFFTSIDWNQEIDVPFFYCAKPSKAERNAGLDELPEKQNHHPTVKPLALMRYLVRLVTPPGGTVLEPFAGSGTTVVASILEGFHCVAIELTEDYLPIIEARCEWAKQQEASKPLQMSLEENE